MNERFTRWLAASLLMLCLTPVAHADRVKDLASVAAARTNQLVG